MPDGVDPRDALRERVSGPVTPVFTDQEWDALTPEQQQTANEDWIKFASGGWDFWMLDGSPVNTLEGMVAQLGTSLEDAVHVVLDLPAGRNAPPELRAEAEQFRS